MKYVVHGRSIKEDPYKELGFCFDIGKGPVMLRYRTSSPEKIIDTANSMPRTEAINGIRKLLKKHQDQIDHKSLENLPRFKKGIQNSVEFYKNLIETLENINSHL